eukprot:CAMPEP_0182939894 /NCGR_PEP_ID=MMETSP0105_2-20130417/46434_1 /TAXON_ID=81532 ORGANISM="Acanthoeca-like sp., Strain 10tr" /NCGR_SAMPLE_ID=MMETSP0105_2 /ASSEMBLY_ACC=CAM_ASM_000205 /LENGTH=171 /DNA_ID=CAMNT_0025079349 /DNA_START=731 /DNA_END=1248 /DNA_ORIENTATION=+
MECSADWKEAEHQAPQPAPSAQILDTANPPVGSDLCGAARGEPHLPQRLQVAEVPPSGLASLPLAGRAHEHHLPAWVHVASRAELAPPPQRHDVLPSREVLCVASADRHVHQVMAHPVLTDATTLVTETRIGASEPQLDARSSPARGFTALSTSAPVPRCGATAGGQSDST